MDGAQGGTGSSRGGHWWPLVAVLAVAVGLGGLGLDLWPRIWADEVFYLDPIRALISEGRFASPIFGTVRGLDRAFYLQPPGFPLLLAPALWFGGVEPTAIRLVPVLAYLAAGLVVSGWTTTLLRWRGVAEPALFGVVAAAIVLGDWSLIYGARGARPDSAAVLLTALAGLALVKPAPSPGRTLVAGLTIGLAGLVHPVAGVLGVALGMGWVASRWGDGRRLVPLLAAGALGVALPLALWGLYIAQAPDLWREQFLDHIIGASVGLKSEPVPLPLRPFKHLAFHYRFAPWVPVLVAFALATLRPRRKPSDRAVVGVAAGVLLLLLPGEAFTRITVGSVAVLAALGLVSVRGRLQALGKERWWPALVATLVVLQMTPPVARQVGIQLQREDRDPQLVTGLVQRHIPPGVPVIAVPDAYYALVANDNPILYPEALAYLRYPVLCEDRDAHQRDIVSHRPGWLVLTSAQDPVDLFPYLSSARFERVDALSTELMQLGPFKRKGWDLVLWKVRYLR